MASKLPYYPLYVDDFDRSEKVCLMTNSEVGLYIRCLNRAWREGSIPSDPTHLAAVLNQNRRELLRDWPAVSKCWVPAPDDQGRLINPRQETERVKAKDKSQKATDAVRTRYSRATDVARTYNGRSTKQIINVTPRAFDSGSDSESRKESAEGKPNPLYERYRHFLAKWPEHRTGEDLGAQVWQTFVDSGEINESNVDEAFEGLERWKLSEQWSKDGGKYIPAIANDKGSGWLQMRRWKDHPRAAGEKSKWD